MSAEKQLVWLYKSEDESSMTLKFVPTSKKKFTSNIAIKVGMVLVATSFMSVALASTLNCNKIASAVERIICNNSRLTDLDGQLNAAYADALKAASPPSKNALIQEQRNWIKYTRGSCDDAACLEQAYTSRVSILKRNEKYIIDERAMQVSVDGEMRNVVFQRDPNGRIASFNEALSRKGNGKIIVCQRLVDLPVGFAHSNNSYGGYCIIERNSTRNEVEICNDDMIGHFAIVNVNTSDRTDDGLIEFTSKNCFGG